MANTLELLLGANINIDKPTREVELKRLSKAVKGEVVFKLQAIPIEDYFELRKQADGDLDKLEIHVLLNGIVEPNLKDKNLLSRYNCITPKDFIQKILLPGELNKLYSHISELSGFNSNLVEEVKN